MLASDCAGIYKTENACWCMHNDYAVTSIPFTPCVSSYQVILVSLVH